MWQLFLLFIFFGIAAILVMRDIRIKSKNRLSLNKIKMEPFKQEVDKTTKLVVEKVTRSNEFESYKNLRKAEGQMNEKLAETTGNIDIATELTLLFLWMGIHQCLTEEELLRLVTNPTNERESLRKVKNFLKDRAHFRIKDLVKILTSCKNKNKSQEKRIHTIRKFKENFNSPIVTSIEIENGEERREKVPTALQNYSSTCYFSAAFASALPILDLFPPKRPEEISKKNNRDLYFLSKLYYLAKSGKKINYSLIKTIIRAALDIPVGKSTKGERNSSDAFETIMKKFEKISNLPSETVLNVNSDDMNLREALSVGKKQLNKKLITFKIKRSEFDAKSTERYSGNGDITLLPEKRVGAAKIIDIYDQEYMLTSATIRQIRIKNTIFFNGVSYVCRNQNGVLEFYTVDKNGKKVDSSREKWKMAAIKKFNISKEEAEELCTHPTFEIQNGVVFRMNSKKEAIDTFSPEEEKKVKSFHALSVMYKSGAYFIIDGSNMQEITSDEAYQLINQGSTTVNFVNRTLLDRNYSKKKDLCKEIHKTKKLI